MKAIVMFYKNMDRFDCVCAQYQSTLIMNKIHNFLNTNSFPLQLKHFNHLLVQFRYIRENLVDPKLLNGSVSLLFKD